MASEIIFEIFPFSSRRRIPVRIYSRDLMSFDEEEEEGVQQRRVEFYPPSTSMLLLFIKWKVSKGILPLLGNRRIIH